MQRPLLRNVRALVLFSLFRGFSVSGYQALFAAYMKTVGYDMASIGGVVTASSLMGALIAPGFGAVIDCVGARIITTLTGLLLVASLGLLELPPGLPVLVASYTLFMLGFLLGQPARSALMARSVPRESLGYYISLTTTAFAVSRIAGPYLSGLIVVKRSYMLAFAVLTLAALIGTIVFHALSVEAGKRRCTSLGRDIVAAYKRSLRPHRALRKFYLFLVIDRNSWSLWFPLLSAQLKAAGYREDMIGLFYTSSSVMMSATSIAWGKLADKLGSKILAVSELLGLLAAVFVAAMKPWYYPLLGLSFAGLSIAAWVPAYNRAIALLASRENIGEAYASANAVRSLAGAPTPIIGGAIYDSFGARALYTVSGALLLLAGIYAYYFAEKIEQGAKE